MSSQAIMHIQNVTKSFARGGEKITVLKNLNLEVGEGEFLGIMGPSGSGKTTMLNLIAGLDRPDTGELRIGSAIVSQMTEAQLASWRTRNIGFIFQFYHLLPVLNAYENVTAYTNSNAPLQSAWSAGKWTRAAEIIRYSNAGWAPADIQKFSAMLTKVVVPIIHDGSNYNGNWELTQIEAMMGIAVFTDDHALFDHAVDFWKQRVPAYFYYAPIDGEQPAPPPRGIPPRGKSLWAGQTVFNATLNGMPQEACRDFHHSAYGLSATMAAAETAHIQGLKLYESEQPRLMAAMEFMSYYQLKNPVPNYLCGGSLKLATGSTFVIGYNEYSNRLGQPLPYTKKWIETGVLTNPLPTDIGAHTTVFEPLTHIADAGSRSPARK